jgi:carbamoyltransferase
LEGEAHEYDPLVGWRLIPNSRARLASIEFDTTISVNPQGLRMSRDIEFRTESNRRRILVFGNSFTFGHGVEATDRFTEGIESIVDGVEVVNFGISATGTDQHYLLYHEYGARFDADLVVLCYLVNHIQRNTMRYISGRFKPRFELIDGDLELINVPVPTGPTPDRLEDRTGPALRGTGIPIPFKRFLRQHSEFYKFVRDRIGNSVHRFLQTNPNPFPEYRFDSEAWRITDALFEKFSREVKDDGKEFLLVILPVPEFLYVDHLNNRPFEMLVDSGARHGFPVLNLLPKLKNSAADSGQRLYYETDSHWNPEGHAAAAKIIAAFLADQFEWIRIRGKKNRDPIHENARPLATATYQ